MPAASAAAAAAQAAPVAPVRTGKKKLVVIALAALLALALAGGGAGFWLWKKKQAALAAAEDGEGADAAQLASDEDPSKHRDGHVPTFVPLDMFTVNLADRSAERYAQVGVTLELEDDTQLARIKAFMPAIRNNILLVLGDKTAAQLMDRDGKQRLAAEIRRAAVKPLGIELPEPVAEAASGAEGEGSKPRRRAAASDEGVPVVAVHFSNFIIQ